MLTNTLDVVLDGVGKEDTLIVINSFDGAILGVTDKKQLNMTSFSTALFSNTALIKGLTPANTSLILTWKQVIGDENVPNTFPAVKDMYNWMKGNARTGKVHGRNYVFYEVHDCKMLYNLTQHSKRNREFHPMLLCACQRGDGVVDPNHICKLLCDGEHIDLFEKSLKMFADNYTTMQGYNKAKQRRHCEMYNKGCMHYGFYTLELLFGTIRFDVFHLRAAVTRKLLNFLSKFLRQHNTDRIS